MLHIDVLINQLFEYSLYDWCTNISNNMIIILRLKSWTLYFVKTIFLNFKGFNDVL